MHEIYKLYVSDARNVLIKPNFILIKRTYCWNVASFNHYETIFYNYCIRETWHGTGEEWLKIRELALILLVRKQFSKSYNDLPRSRQLKELGSTYILIFSSCLLLRVSHLLEMNGNESFWNIFLINYAVKWVLWLISIFLKALKLTSQLNSIANPTWDRLAVCKGIQAEGVSAV